MLAVRARLQGWALVLFFVPGKMKLTAERYRTASGSDRIIFHLSLAIGHWEDSFLIAPWPTISK